MENNQHINSGNAAAKEQESKPFSNSQPGQQLPAENKSSEETLQQEVSNIVKAACPKAATKHWEHRSIVCK
ncbi:MAG TPA: hypothetical protein VMR70_09245 [Flavisolibacter sp.]|nr:hypothetical protein [Flavisolibacter sp.]